MRVGVYICVCDAYHVNHINVCDTVYFTAHFYDQYYSI